MSTIKYTYQIGNQYVDTMDFNEIPENATYTTSEVVELPEPIVVPETISKMALEIQLLLMGITEQDVVDTIMSIPDSLFSLIEKQKAVIKYKSATSFDRYNADLNLVATLMSLSQQNLDVMFINGNSQ